MTDPLAAIADATRRQLSLFDPPSSGPCSVSEVNGVLASSHYLGPIDRGFAWSDEYGVAVFSSPVSRRLPSVRWLELRRWCLYGVRNGGSRQWSRIVAWLRSDHPVITTVISYSDPSVGHTGAVYKACGWKWRPTWHRLRPPPSGNGRWSSKQESVKDRWMFPLRADAERESLLAVKDEAICRRMKMLA
jgi:hypothetical protein